MEAYKTGLFLGPNPPAIATQAAGKIDDVLQEMLENTDTSRIFEELRTGRKHRVSVFLWHQSRSNRKPAALRDRDRGVMVGLAAFGERIVLGVVMDSTDCIASPRGRANGRIGTLLF